MTEPLHPNQAVYMDGKRARFRANKIVRFLVDFAQSKGIGLNELGSMPFDAADRMQLAQLIGYSVDGYAELSYVSDESKYQADLEAERVEQAAKTAGVVVPLRKDP